MKRYEHDKYDTKSFTGASRLVVHGNTLEKIRSEIDESNRRCIERGYKAVQWIITHREFYNWYDDHGRFVKSEEIEQAVEIYPPEL